MTILIVDPVSAGIALSAISALIGGGASFWNTYQQKKANEANIKAARDAAAQEQQWNQENWAKENAYNHPEQQMNRLRQAGLNPNLVYGRGADTTAGSISSTNVKVPNLQAPQFDAMPMVGEINKGIQQYNQVRLANATIDQTNSTIALQQKERQLKDAQILNTNIDYGTKLKLQDYLVKKADLENKNLDAFTQIGIDRNERERLANTSNLKLQAQELLNKKVEWLLQHQKYATTALEQQKINAEINNLKQMNYNLHQEGVLKKFEADMAKKGIDPKSPWYWKEFNSTLQGKGTINILNDKLNKFIGYEKDSTSPLGYKFNWFD